MQLRTERLILRETTINDLQNIHQLHSFPEVDEFNTMGIPSSIKETEKLINEWIASQIESPQKKYVFAIENSEKQFIGLVGINIGKPKYFNAEIWYKLLPQFWNNGFATESVNEILNFCFTELKLHRVEAGCATENISSINVLEKSGFIKEGLRRKLLPIRGKWLDNFEFAILEEDFL